MRKLVLPLTALVLLVMQSGFAPAAAPETLTAALTAARADSGVPFHLEINCTERDSRRSLEVIRGSVAIWGNDRQVRLSGEDRGALIDLLLKADFAHFAPRYGETPKADKQEAPLRVYCRIHVALQGVEKTSVQVMDGEQSEQLLSLARRLLDRIEPLAADGVMAADLEDGLAKLADGALAPEVLRLRLLSLHESENGRAGSILRIEDGRVSRQPYAPGTAVGKIRAQDLSACQLRAVVAALRDAAFPELPINLHRAGGMVELEVSVLGQRKFVSSRPGFEPASSTTQAAFADMLKRLADLPSSCN